MVADEVDDGERILAVLDPEAAAQLLQEDDRRLRGPQHQHGVDVGDVETLVEQVDGEDDFQLTAAQFVERLMPWRTRRPAVH